MCCFLPFLPLQFYSQLIFCCLFVNNIFFIPNINKTDISNHKCQFKFTSFNYFHCFMFITRFLMCSKLFIGFYFWTLDFDAIFRNVISIPLFLFSCFVFVRVCFCLLSRLHYNSNQLFYLSLSVFVYVFLFRKVANSMSNYYKVYIYILRLNFMFYIFLAFSLKCLSHQWPCVVLCAIWWQFTHQNRSCSNRTCVCYIICIC